MRIYSINYDTKNYKQLDLLKHYKEENENRKLIYKIPITGQMRENHAICVRVGNPAHHL